MPALRRLAALVIATLAAGPVAAQDGRLVGTYGLWSVFQEADPTECYAVSQVSAPLNGQSRDAFLYASFKPAEGAEPFVTFTGGYPFDPGAPVTLTVGGKKFVLFTQDGWAWPGSPADDARIIDALGAGQAVTVTGRTGQRLVSDRFSLDRFDDALDEARARCGG